MKEGVNIETIGDNIPSKDELLERLNFALKSARMGAFDCDLAGGAMLWDARMHELFGVAPGNFSGAYDDFLSLVHFEDRPRLAMEMAAAFDKRTNFAVKFRVIYPSVSAIRPLEMGFKVHSDTEGRPQRFSGVCWEVAEQRWPETALVPERYLLATMMDNLTDLIYFKDRESRFTAVNRLFLCRAGLKEQSDIRIVARYHRAKIGERGAGELCPAARSRQPIGTTGTCRGGNCRTV